MRELICCLGRINFEHLLYIKKHFVSCKFPAPLMSCKNAVVLSVMEVFVRTEEYKKESMTLQMICHMIMKLRLCTV